MEVVKKKNYMSGIHLEDYTEQYEGKQATVDTMALTDEERIENLMIAKELVCNFMRIAHYPHHERMAKLADEVGMLLWEEIPVYWAIKFDREKTYEDAENQLRELITRDWKSWNSRGDK
uniref:glycoside hydrolase family 2 TIM barrel-domain containing protein n=1 Tax=Acetatifactor sp. TaxID=1872090 RepID=UPI0040564936